MIKKISILIIFFVSVFFHKILIADEKKTDKKDEPKEIIWLKDLNDALKQAKSRKCPIILYLGFDNPHKEAQKFENAVFKNSNFIKKSYSFVSIYCKINKDKKLYDDLGREGWITPQEVKGIVNLVFFDYEKNRLNEFTLSKSLSADSLVNHLNKVLKKTGEGLSYDKYLEYNKTLDNVEKLLSEKNYFQAIFQLKSLKDDQSACGFSDFASTKLDEINRIGEEKLQSASLKEQNGEIDSAIETLKDIIKTFYCLPVKDRAKELLKQFEEKKKNKQ